jgi:dTDP-4-dehydrorhamnose reductase
MPTVTGILVLGANGQVGHELLKALPGPGVVALTSADLDLSRPADIRAAVRRLRPGIIVNAAAYTAVDRAETDAGAAMAVNAAAPGILAEEARRAGGVLVHYSTDFVFDGSKHAPYLEDDATAPLNVYGRSKRDGELAIAAVDVPSLVFRTSWVYGLRGRNFLLTMRRLLLGQDEVRVVEDQFGAPTWSRAIARATADVLSVAGAGFRDYIGERRGVYHMTAAGRISWRGFAVAIAQDLESRGEKVARVAGIPSSAYAAPARRPANSVLDNSKLMASFGLSMGHWREMLAECLAGSGPTC